MRFLVTGATGFVGGHLLRALADRPGVELVGLDRAATWPPGRDDLAGRVRLVAVDLLDRPALTRAVADARPDRIVHLAGFASPARSLREPFAAWEGNLTATLNLYQALVETGLRPRVLFASTGQVYGDQPAGVLLTEDAPLRPNNPYAASKAAADLAGFQYFASAGLHVLRARPFNHIGPGQSPDYAVASFARQVAAIERGQQPPVLETGDLEPRRDLTDVRDIVAAYLLLLEHGEAGQAYNIASGATVSMREVLDRLLALAGRPIEVRTRADLLRNVDLSVPAVDTTRLRTATGWRPTVALDRALADVLAAWRRSPN